MTKIYYGTAGWSYKDWVGAFYAKAQSVKYDWLTFYSEYFNCVEVNSSYYSYINPRVVEGWIEKVSGAEDFLFTVKLHQDFTHRRNYTEENIKGVNFVLEKLAKAGCLGGLLIQFPYSFPFNDSNAEYIRKLKEVFQGFQSFIEVRHKSWLNKETFDLLKQLDFVYTTIDLPQIGASLPFELKTTNDKAYLRLHGRNVKEWSKSIRNYGKEQTYEQRSARYDYLYSPAELISILRAIKPLLKMIKLLFVIFNNHPKGNAVANAFEFKSSLENDKLVIPKPTLSTFPRLERIAADEDNFSLRP